MLNYPIVFEISKVQKWLKHISGDHSNSYLQIIADLLPGEKDSINENESKILLLEYRSVLRMRIHSLFQRESNVIPGSTELLNEIEKIQNVEYVRVISFSNGVTIDELGRPHCSRLIDIVYGAESEIYGVMYFDKTTDE